MDEGREVIALSAVIITLTVRSCQGNFENSKPALF
jgi:hypothetical protein